MSRSDVVSGALPGNEGVHRTKRQTGFLRTCFCGSSALPEGCVRQCARNVRWLSTRFDKVYQKVRIYYRNSNDITLKLLYNRKE